MTGTRPTAATGQAGPGPQLCEGEASVPGHAGSAAPETELAKCSEPSRHHQPVRFRTYRRAGKWEMRLTDLLLATEVVNRKEVEIPQCLAEGRPWRGRPAGQWGRHSEGSSREDKPGSVRGSRPVNRGGGQAGRKRTQVGRCLRGFTSLHSRGE